jgi:RNA polymerase sigma-70 factor (sigma-E family)
MTTSTAGGRDEVEPVDQPPRLAAVAPDGGAPADPDVALALLFTRHYLPLVRLAACLTGDRDSAEDVVQDAFVALQRHRATLRDPSAAEAYLRSAVVNGSRSQVRRLVRERLRRRPAQVPTASSEDAAVERDEHDRVFAAVQALPTRQREVVVCRYYLELSEAETARLLEISAGSVKRHAHRAVKAVQTRVEVTA